jgi:magnesium transporter
MAPVITVRWIESGVMRSDGMKTLPTNLTGAVWIDVLEPDIDALAAVGARFDLPPLAVEDCLHFPQRPKIDVYPDVTFLVWLLPWITPGDGVSASELDVFLGKESLVTVHKEPIVAIDRIAENAEEYLKRGVEWMLHAILDVAVDESFPVVEVLSDELEVLEDLMLSDARPSNLQRLYAAKRSLVNLHKIIGPERDVLRGLARLEAFVEPDAYMYFQDIGDHLARVADEIDTYRDVASGTMDIYLSSVSNRMNAIMKQLTIIATIFMPLTLMSGIYGMNITVGMWPPIDKVWSFPLVIGSMLAITVWMLWIFRRRDWW